MSSAGPSRTSGAGEPAPWSVTPRRWAVAAGILAVIGTMLLATSAVHNARHVWKPLELPLPLEANERVTGTFMADVAAVHEIVLEVDSVLSEARMHDLLSGAEDYAGPDVRWDVSRDERLVAVGGSSDAVYLSTGGRTWPGRVRRWLLGIPFHAGGGSFARVVGRVPCDAGVTYTVGAVHGGIASELATGNARVVVQLSREFWTRHSAGMAAVAAAGAVLVFAAFACAVAYAAVSRRHRLPRA